MPVPTFVVDYPEAHIAMAHIESVRGVTRAGVLHAHGSVPDAATLVDHSLPSEPFIIVNGSGDFHHETVTFLEAFLRAHPGQRFAYIQIDAHPDKDDTFRWKLDCASFVGRVMERDEIENVTLVGLYPEALDTTNTGNLIIRNLRYFRVPYFQKLQQFIVGESPVHETMFKFLPGTADDARANRSVKNVEELRLEMPGQSHLPEKLRDGIVDAIRVKWKTVDEMDPASDFPDLPVYLTIDLDVAREKIVTDWRRDPSTHDRTTWGYGDNQGNMAWDRLLEIVETIGQTRRILGADVCGISKEIHNCVPEARSSSLDAMVDIYDALTRAIACGGQPSSSAAD